jgi:hypothetical protein
MKAYCQMGPYSRTFRFSNFHSVQHNAFIDTDGETTDGVNATPDFVLQGCSARTKIR